MLQGSVDKVPEVHQRLPATLGLFKQTLQNEKADGEIEAP
jgi:hypothetical protein